jgi:hypothetical protein
MNIEPHRKMQKVTSFYLTEVVWPADSEGTGLPLKFRLIARCVTKTDCEMQAEGRAKSHAENGFDSSRDAWWGKSGGWVHYYHQTTSLPSGTTTLKRPLARIRTQAV